MEWRASYPGSTVEHIDADGWRGRVSPNHENGFGYSACVYDGTEQGFADAQLHKFPTREEARTHCLAELAQLRPGWAAMRKRLIDALEQLNTPELQDFAKGVVSEAQHQRGRWGAEHDSRKTNADWFWLIGYLAGKALRAAEAGDGEKALHHTISTAAALANWHAALAGANNTMRPGIDPARAREAQAQGRA